MNIISLVSYPFLPAKSGGQKGIALFYKYFARRHSVTIVTTRNNQPSDAEGYELLNTISTSPSRYINPFVFFSLRNLIRKKKATHLILEHPYYGWLGILLKKICRVRLIVHSHNMEGKRWKSLGKWWWPILWNYEKWTHRQADFNFFIQDEDRKYAIRAFGLDENKCITINFGTEMYKPISPEKRMASSKSLHLELQINEDIPLMLFNGAFGYSPNRDALENLLFKINPLLQAKGIPYMILVMGLDIPDRILHISLPGIRILGFVENLDYYLTGSQVFLNPVNSGGGIKTKLVEALAYGLNTASTENGAIGVDPKLCNGKLVICPDNDWKLFTDAILQVMDIRGSTPQTFYDHFYWDHIAHRAARFIEEQK